MKKVVKYLNALICLCMVSFGITATIKHNCKMIDNSLIRIVDVKNEINYDSEFYDVFDNTSIEQDDSVTRLIGYKTIDKDLLTELDLISYETSFDDELTIKYEFSYDYEINIVTVKAVLSEDNTTFIDTIYGSAFVNDDGELDAVMYLDGDYILLSEMQDRGLIVNCGWFSKMLKKVAVVAACAAAVVAVAAVTVCSCGVGGAVVAGLTAGAVAGGLTGEVVSYQETGKIQPTAVLAGVGVGAAVGAVTGYVAGSVTYAVTSTPAGLGTIDSSSYYSTLSDGQIKNYASAAANNENSMSTYIGKYIDGSSNSYDTIAKSNNGCYFYLSNYDSLSSSYGQTQVELINKQFIINRLALNNTFYSTTNPNVLQSGSFAKELQWISDYLGGNNYYWVKVGDSLWKLVKK